MPPMMLPQLMSPQAQGGTVPMPGTPGAELMQLQLQLQVAQLKQQMLMMGHQM